MKSVNISDFKEHCLELLNAESIAKEPILVLRRGKAVALVSAPDRTSGTSLRGSVVFKKPGIESVNFADEWPI